MVRVVLDTNVYVSAFNFDGIPLEILVLGIRKEIDIFISPSILKEIEGVLLHKFKWPVKQLKEVIANIQGFTQSVRPQEKINLIKEDESDNRILECAKEAKAHLIVTGDKHLLKLGKFHDMKILSPRKLLESKVWV